MNFKYLIIVSLILAIMTVSVVSASEDIASNETLSQSDADDTAISEAMQESCENLASEESSDIVAQEIDEVDEDVLSYSEDDSIIEAADEPDEVLGDYSSGSVTIELYNYVDITDKYSNLGYVYDDNGLKGTVTLTIDGKKVFSKKFTSRNKYSCYIGNEEVDLKKIGYGYHNVKLTYNDGKVKSDSRKINFVAVPSVSYPSRMAVGEENGISIEGEKLNGTATLFSRIITGYDEYKDPIYKKGSEIKTVKIIDGYGWIPLDTLSNGSQSFQLEYKFGTYDDVKTFKIDVRQNSPEFKSSLSATKIVFGEKITAKLTGPKADGDANIYVDNDYFKSVRFNFGKMNEAISGLSAGKHLITISYYDYDSDLFYSKTYNVFVKHEIKLKLPKVKVKKSARKLVIKATLKIDGKVVKNKKLKFKFKNKKYTAKTNKKGVAKITIKKSILKKLKKGKKVKYEVSYGGKTVEKTVKVKK